MGYAKIKIDIQKWRHLRNEPSRYVKRTIKYDGGWPIVVKFMKLLHNKSYSVEQTAEHYIIQW